MGTNYYLINEATKSALELGKFYALAEAAGVCDATPVRPVTSKQVEQSKRGWFMPWKTKHGCRREDEWMDVEWSASLARSTESWLREVATGDVQIFRETESVPWPTDALGYPAADLEGWTLWTLYTHPVHQGAEPPWKLWPRCPSSSAPMED